MLSRYLLDFSVGVGVFVIGLSQISSLFSHYFYLNKKHRYFWYSLSYTLTTISMAQRRVILIHCLYLAKLNPVLRIGWHGSVGRALERWSGNWLFAPVVRYSFSSQNVRLLAYVFTDEDPLLEWLKRNESNRVYSFEARFWSLVYMYL